MVLVGKSLLKIINMSGPRILPLGTPCSARSFGSEYLDTTWMTCFLSRRYEENHAWVWSETRIFLAFPARLNGQLCRKRQRDQVAEQQRAPSPQKLQAKDLECELELRLLSGYQGTRGGCHGRDHAGQSGYRFEEAQWAWNEPRLTRGAAQIGLHTVFTCGPLIMELSITKSRIELIKTYFTFLLSRNVDNFNVITTGLFHFCVNMNVKNTLKLYLKCSSKTTYTATEHK